MEEGAMSTTVTLRIPALPGGREFARGLLRDLRSAPDEILRVDASAVEAAAPSFIDELCKELLVTRSFLRVDLLDASEHFNFVFARSAKVRQVADRWRSCTAVPA